MQFTERVLIVDDSDDVRFSLARRLQRIGFTDIHTANDGEEGLHRIRNESFDLVLLDIMMPKLTGYEVLEELRNTGVLSELPVIVLSAIDDTAAAVRCIETGAEDYLPKPINTTLLVARIRNAIEKKRLRDDVGRQLRLIRQVLGRYVPDSVVQDVVQGAGTLDPTLAQATIMYTDLAGFTGIVEKLSPADAFTMLNEYFSAISTPVLAEGGTITQFQGDAMLITFNAPVPDPRHADAAVAAARRIQQIHRERTFHGVRLKTRIGINTGMVMAGNIGTDSRISYTVHGDAVNVAARLEQLNKTTDTAVLVSRSTVDAMTCTAALEKVTQQAIRGRETPVEIYTLTDDD